MLTERKAAIEEEEKPPNTSPQLCREGSLSRSVVPKLQANGFVHVSQVSYAVEITNIG
jgi:hypothetical protein